MKNIGNGMRIYLCTRYEEYWEWDEYLSMYYVWRILGMGWVYIYVLGTKNIGNGMSIYIYVLGMKNIGNGMSICLCSRYEEYWEWDEYLSMY